MEAKFYIYAEVFFLARVQNFYIFLRHIGKRVKRFTGHKGLRRVQFETLKWDSEEVIEDVVKTLYTDIHYKKP